MSERRTRRRSRGVFPFRDRKRGGVARSRAGWTRFASTRMVSELKRAVKASSAYTCKVRERTTRRADGLRRGINCRRKEAGRTAEQNSPRPSPPASQLQHLGPKRTPHLYLQSSRKQSHNAHSPRYLTPHRILHADTSTAARPAHPDRSASSKVPSQTPPGTSSAPSFRSLTETHLLLPFRSPQSPVQRFHCHLVSVG